MQKNPNNMASSAMEDGNNDKNPPAASIIYLVFNFEPSISERENLLIKETFANLLSALDERHV